ncbi:MAG: hypothetical protein ACK559_07170 [bacterium]
MEVKYLLALAAEGSLRIGVLGGVSNGEMGGGDFPNHDDVEYAGEAGISGLESEGDVRGGVLEVK